MSTVAAQVPRPRRRLKFLLLILVAAWLVGAIWNSVKPLPPGVHQTSLSARLADSQVEFLVDTAQQRALLSRQLSAIDHAEQMILVDQTPLAHDVAQHLLARKHQRPNLKIVVTTDQREAAAGGSPREYLATLERAGVIVARTRLDRLRDPNPLYGSAWRLVFGWWSEPFDDVADQGALRAGLRRGNFQANERQLLVADDGAGGWLSVIASAATANQDGATGNTGVLLHGRLAREIVASELRIARWSTEDDRLPADLPVETRSAGTIDARILTEGATRSSVLDALEAANLGDTLEVATGSLSDRATLGGLLRAAGRGTSIRILLDPDIAPNPVVAAELARGGGGHIELRWLRGPPREPLKLLLIHHATDAWLLTGSANLTRRCLDDLNLEANIELRLPQRAAPARAAAAEFTQAWIHAQPYAARVDTQTTAYWRYRVAEATGLAAY